MIARAKTPRALAGALAVGVVLGALLPSAFGKSEAAPTAIRSALARGRGGDWIVEQPSDIHEATTGSSRPVVIYIATLLKDGAPPSSPVTLPPVP